MSVGSNQETVNGPEVETDGLGLFIDRPVGEPTVGRAIGPTKLGQRGPGPKNLGLKNRGPGVPGLKNLGPSGLAMSIGVKMDVRQNAAVRLAPVVLPPSNDG